MPLKKLLIVFATITYALFSVIGNISCGLDSTKRQLHPGDQYKIIGLVYLSGIYKDLNKRQFTQKMAVASLTAIRFSGPEVAYQRKVPLETSMTIIGPAPKRLALPFYADQYFVELEPNMSSGLDIILELNRGIEGSLDGLNPELFSRQ